MVAFCCIVGCTMRADRDRDKVSFYRIPAIIGVNNRKYQTLYRTQTYRQINFLDKSADKLIEQSKERQKLWENAIRRGKLTKSQLSYFRICSNHFISGRLAELTDTTNPDWVPCKNLGYKVGVTLKKESDFDMYNRCIGRRNAQENILVEKVIEPQVTNSTEINLADIDPTCLNFDSSAKNIESDHRNHVFENQLLEEDVNGMDGEVPGGVTVKPQAQTQTEIKMQELTDLFNKLSLYNTEILKYKARVKKFDLSQESFQNDDSKTKYPTGLATFKILNIIHDMVAPHLFTRSNASLSTFHQLLITLMTLRLNLPFKYLSYRFGVSPFTVSKYFRRCLHVLYTLFKDFIVWPDREILHATMPQCFKESFGNTTTTVIIDCFEIFIQKPRNLYASAECWSSYKHHRTLKYLIGITPQGSVSFVSDGYGGRASDKHVTEDSGFLDLLLPGSVVFADRGFMIEDMVNAVQAKLQIPAFTKGKSQLHPKDLEETRSIAHVRIHVERVIGSLRQKYRILSGTVPIRILRTRQNGKRVYDEIIHVCCALLNLYPSMVSST